MSKIHWTKWFDLDGEIYEIHNETQIKKGVRIYRDGGARLRHPDFRFSKRNDDGSIDQQWYKNNPLRESLETKPFPFSNINLKEGYPDIKGLYHMKDETFPDGFYIGRAGGSFIKGKWSEHTIFERVYKHVSKILGTTDLLDGVDQTEQWINFRDLRKRKGFTGLETIKIRFWICNEDKRIKPAEDEAMLRFAGRNQGKLPYCNNTPTIFEEGDF